jgi:hypothetical protein
MLVLAFLLIPFFIFFPVHLWLSKALRIRISPLVLVFLSPVALTLFVALLLGSTGCALFLLAVFNTWAFLFAFSVDRRYIYILAVTFLAFVPFLLFFTLKGIAEYFAILCYFSLVVGITKDIFYEKLFTK